MSIQLSENEPRVRYTLAEGVSQSAFSVPFEFFDDADLVVYVDTVAKSEGADYTVSGGGGSTGTVTFLSALVGAVGDSEIVIVRRIPVERVTDFLAGSDINRAALNEQLDILTAMVADANDKASLAVRVADFELPINFVIPPVAQRANTYFAFDANGDVSVTSGTTSTIVVSTFVETLLGKADSVGFLDGLGIAASPAEINVLDGVTGIASLAEAQAGIDNTKLMTPLRVVQSISENTPKLTQGQAEDPTSTVFGQVSGQRLRQASATISIGVGQTWQDVTASRSIGTTYQNTAGRPIAVGVGFEFTSARTAFEVSLDGVSWLVLALIPTSGTGSGTARFTSLVIPNLTYYRTRVEAGSVTLASWLELR